MDDDERLEKTIRSAALVLFCPWLIAIDLTLVMQERLLMVVQELLEWPRVCNELQRQALEGEES